MSKHLHGARDIAVWPVNTTLHVLDAEHAAEIHHLLVKAYATGGGTVPSFVAWWASLIDDAEFDSKLCFLVRTNSGELIAFLHCWTSAFVKDLVVHPDYRRQGLARALLLHIFSVLKTRGEALVSLKVHTDNTAAINLYRQIGMKVDG